LTDQQLDELVARHVFGYQTVGLATIRWFDGLASVLPVTEDVEDETRPVYVERCVCAMNDTPHLAFSGNNPLDLMMRQIYEGKRAEWEQDVRVWGHSRDCLAPVPHFSTRLDDAWRVLTHVKERGVQVRSVPEGWLAEIGGYQSSGTSAARAICLAALG
jgi:hypothetical protein